jgi:hypothetical protein
MTTTDVFIDIGKDHYSIKPRINALSDHDAQLIAINNIKSIFTTWSFPFLLIYK